MLRSKYTRRIKKKPKVIKHLVRKKKKTYGGYSELANVLWGKWKISVAK